MLAFVPGSDVGLSHCVCSPIGDLAGGGGWFHPPWLHYGLSTNPQTHVGVQTGHGFIQWHTEMLGVGGTPLHLGWAGCPPPPTAAPTPGWLPGPQIWGCSPLPVTFRPHVPVVLSVHPQGGPGLRSWCLAPCWGGGFLSPWPPSAPSSSAAAGPGSSTISHPGTGNGASLASPSSSPWVRMFLEITVGTGDAGVGSTGVGWGELQLVPLP